MAKSIEDLIYRKGQSKEVMTKSSKSMARTMRATKKAPPKVSKTPTTTYKSQHVVGIDGSVKPLSPQKSTGGGSGAGATAGAAGAAGAATLAQGGTATDATSAALMATGDPYAMAAGVGLSMVSASAKRKREAHNKREEHRYAAETDRRNSTMNALKAAQQAASAFA